MPTKEQIRKKCKEARNALFPQTVKKESEEICGQILKSELFRRAKQCLLYYPLGNEADVLPLFQACIREGKEVAFPKVVGEDIVFIRVESENRFKEGYFHVMEPVGEPVLCREQALVITPGVAFDRKGGRIGYGKGFYDRFFAAHPTVIRAGVALQCQMVPDVNGDEWDRKMDHLFTSMEWIKIREDRG